MFFHSHKEFNSSRVHHNFKYSRTYNKALKCMMQKLSTVKGNKSTIIIGDFDTTLSIIDKPRQKTSTDIEDLSDAQ